MPQQHISPSYKKYKLSRRTLKPGFIQEKNHGPQLFGPLFQLGIGLVQPQLDCCGIALIGPA
jgi:hypothetical protein